MKLKIGDRATDGFEEVVVRAKYRDYYMVSYVSKNKCRNYPFTMKGSNLFLLNSEEGQKVLASRRELDAMEKKLDEAETAHTSLLKELNQKHTELIISLQKGSRLPKKDSLQKDIILQTGRV